ncbi:MAG: Mur ligase family protein, partial [Bacteroidota bacterium]
MAQLSSENLASWLRTPIGFSSIFRGVATDTRKIANGKNLLFAAIIGPRNNGHHYCQEAYDKGIRHFLVSQEPELPADAQLIMVPDVLIAIQTIASEYRKTWTGEVIAITGSNGKTTVKEWLNEMLFDFTHLFRSPRSYNSQIGVPLSILTPEMDYQHYFIEAGISMPEEMARLQNIIAPNWGIWTNLGLAHVEHFENKEALGLEKAKLFQDCSLVIHPWDDLIQKSLENVGFEGKHLTWGTQQDSQLRVLSSERF